MLSVLVKGKVFVMNIQTRLFLKKFLAALSLEKVYSIPFSGDEFNNGIKAIDDYLINSLDSTTYDSISEMFVKTPVQEVYSLIRDMFMTLNGDLIKFSSIENPYWTNISIKISEREANYLLEDLRYLHIDRSIFIEASRLFCKSACL